MEFSENMSVDKQLHAITTWLQANSKRIQESRCGVSFVHFSRITDEDGDPGSGVSATQMLTRANLVWLCDLCLTNLKEISDPDEPDYNAFLARAIVLLAVVHEKQAAGNVSHED